MFYLPPYILLHEFKVFNGPTVSNSIISQGMKYSQQYCWSYTSCWTQCRHFQGQAVQHEQPLPADLNLQH